MGLCSTGYWLSDNYISKNKIPSPESLTVYPTKSWSVHSTKGVTVFSTMDDSDFTVKSGNQVMHVHMTGSRSKLKVHADSNVYVKSTGDNAHVDVMGCMFLGLIQH